MEKTDAVRKVARLETLADNDGATEAERETARSQATKLREKYGVTDEDVDISEPFMFFGHDLWFFRREIDPLLDKAAQAIEEAMRRADKAEMPRDRVEAFVRIHQAVKHAAEETGYSSYMRVPGPDGRKLGLRLKTRRNEAVKRYFTDILEEDYAQRLVDSREYNGKEPDEDDKEWHRHRAIDHAIFRTALDTDLRRDVIERIVGHKIEFS